MGHAGRAPIPLQNLGVIFTQHPPGGNPRLHPLRERKLSIDNHRADTLCVLFRFCIGGLVLDGVRIKNRDIGIVPSWRVPLRSKRIRWAGLRSSF